jgi:hypothetical protein
MRTTVNARYDRDERILGVCGVMRALGRAVLVVIPLLAAAACSGDPDPPASVSAPTPGAPASDANSVPLRLTPKGLLGFPGAAAGAPSPAAAPSASAAPLPPPRQTAEAAADEPPSEAEVRALYEGIMYTYAFDACGLPLVGETARQDIEHRIEVCPNPPTRKDAFRTVYRRALEVAEQDPEKMRASAGRACPDKREFLRRVMSHANELQFDSAQPADCGLLSPAPPGAPQQAQPTQ